MKLLTKKIVIKSPLLVHFTITSRDFYVFIFLLAIKMRLLKALRTVYPGMNETFNEKKYGKMKMEPRNEQAIRVRRENLPPKVNHFPFFPFWG